MTIDSERKSVISGVRNLHRRLESRVQLGLKKLRPQRANFDESFAMQLQLLPCETPQLDGFRIACAWQPARRVSGDYFDVLPLGDDQLGLCVADVSGKGAEAARLMSTVQALVKTVAKENVSPAVLCSKVNVALSENIAPGRFVTMFYGVLDGRSGTLCYESAGHCRPLLIYKDGTVDILKASSGVLGLFSHWTYSDQEMKLSSGDVLVITTKGVLGAWSADKEEFGYRRLMDSVLASRAQGADAIRKRVLEDVWAFCEGVFEDDASLIVLTVD